MGAIQERTSANGTKTYRCQIRIKGEKSVSATFIRKTDAKRWIQETEIAIRNNRFFDKEESKKHTLSELIERYSEDSLAQRKSQSGPRLTLKWWNTRIGNKTLDQMSTPLIREYWDKLAKTCLLYTSPSPRDS